MRPLRSLTILGVVLLSAATTAMTADAAEPKRMVVFGVDGMDPILLREYIAAGKVPHLAELAASGGFVSLGTSTPPQSPVAWSNFITGTDSGTHGIFDFLHVDRQTLAPYSSTARVAPAKRKPLEIGQWRIPLAAEHTMQLREGTAFWELLEANGVSATLFQIPANYPPIPFGRSISGMGTPDIKGTAGTFTYYTDDPSIAAGSVSGGNVQRIEVRDGVVQATIEGPPNALRAGAPFARTGFTIRPDAKNPVALIEVGERRLLLNAGEWSEWVQIEFGLLPPLVSVTGMVRFYLRQSTPHLQLYVSPVNIDPRDPAQPISFPDDYASDLARAVGPFYTEEMPEDTKALSAHLLDAREFIAQSELVLTERRRILKNELDRFFATQSQSLLFFYFSTIDQRHHMLARQVDPQHPFHDAGTPPDLLNAMANTYAEIDELVGWVMDRMDASTTFVVMSDHGFAPFRRQANLNTWLEQHGYLVLENPARRTEYEWLAGIDWSRTRAFAIGLNSLYLNVRGRERNGIVPVAQRTPLAREIAAALLTWRDPETGGPVVTQPALREDLYHGPRLLDAPDIIVGYARGYRASWATTTGKVPSTLLDDNLEEWSGDHCIDSREVPGVLLANRPIKAAHPDLMDLTATILHEFGVRAPRNVRGDPVF